MQNNPEIPKALSDLHPQMVKEFLQYSQIVEIEKETEILREGQYVKVIPIVLQGLIKVYTRYQDRELLLYYIKPKESCVMSFAAGISNDTSKVYAVTEEDSEILLLPAEKLQVWSRNFPHLNELFFHQYNARYTELLDTINHLLFDKLDKRLLDYLTQKSRLTGENPIEISHRRIANELGTAREVISRVMKKLEKEGHVRQHTKSIELL